jgi:pimeloyl-ACP methyl ester carboxylesterase
LPTLQLAQSPLIPSASPVELHYREWGAGVPLVFLHGGWGYEVYSARRQVEALRDRFRIIAPVRTGYGASGHLEELPRRFHDAAAVETIAVLDAMGIEKAIFWGHSDGAVISAILGITQPERVAGLILEAFHYDRRKTASKGFFETMVSDPDQFGERICRVLAEDHGDPYWRTVLRAGGRAWLRIIDDSDKIEEDLYAGRLSELSVPTLFIHGSRDPRTEPGELAAVQAALPHVPITTIEGGGHSPHSESASYTTVNRVAGDFLASLV